MATELPEQIVGLLTASVGVVFTDMVATAVLVAGQPAADLPVMV